MKFYKSIIAILFVLFCAANVDAQMCGKYRVGLVVLDERGKPINNAVVQFLPITNDETRGKSFERDEKDSSKFSVEYLEGHSLEEFHKLIVSADGYKTAEIEFRFYSCSGLRMQVNLPHAKSAAPPVWLPKNEVSFYISDDNNRQFAGVEISIFKNGEFLKKIRSKSGGIGTNLDFGNYTFKLEKKGYQTEELTADLTKIENPIGFSVNLKKAQ